MAAASISRKRAHRRGAGRGLDRGEGLRVGDLDRLGQHVLRQRQHHRTRAAAGGGVEGAAHEFGNAAGIVDLRHPFGELAEHAAIVDLLEGLALQRVARDLADEEDERRRILHRHMEAGAGVAGAGAARHHAKAGLPRELAIGVRHHRRAAFLAAGDEADRVGVVERVEHGEVALAGNAEHGIGAVDLELIDENLRPAASPHYPASRMLRGERYWTFAAAAMGSGTIPPDGGGSPARRWTPDPSRPTSHISAPMRVMVAT